MPWRGRRSVHRYLGFSPRISGTAAIFIAVSLPLAAFGAPPNDQPAAGPVVIDSGAVTGTFSPDRSIVVYRGIPFAAPPIGDLRWKPPQPVQPWSGKLHADQFGASCMQPLPRSYPPYTREFMTQNETSEDCLTINVFAPRSPGAKLPVLVWIYGGGFREGSSEIPVLDGTQLAKTGMVVVTFNYRVGVFGFLALPELTAESQHHGSGNYGLLDQVAALQWVHKNIGAFGGDPDRVAVCGQSMGSGSVHMLLTSPLATGLFQRAIAESGSGVAFPIRFPLAEGEKMGQAFAARHGAASLRQLRSMSANDLMAGAEGLGYTAVIDGWFLPRPPDETLALGKQNDVPLITGWTADDSRLRSGPQPILTAEQFRNEARMRYGNMAAEFLSLYPASNDDEAARSQIESGRDRDRADMYVWTLRHARASRMPVFTYFFTRPMPDPAHPEFGAFHGGEIPYVFRNLALFDRPWQPVDHRVSDTISTYWKDFAATGDPNGAGVPAWAPTSAANPTTLEIGEHIGPIPIASPAKLSFWMRYFDSTPRSRSRLGRFLTMKMGMVAALLALVAGLAAYRLLRRPTAAI